MDTQTEQHAHDVQSTDQPGNTYQSTNQQGSAAAARRLAWYTEQLRPGTAANTCAVAALLSGPVVDLLPQLRSALRATIAARPALVSRYPGPDGTAQAADPPGQVSAELPAVLDLRGLLEGEREASIQEMLDEIATEPWDLARRPPVRVTLMLTPQGAVLAVAAHRVAADESDLGALLHECAARLLSENTAPMNTVSMNTVPVPAEPALDLVGGHNPDLESASWLSGLGEVPPTRLPADWTRDAEPADVGATVPLALPADLVVRIDTFAAHEGVDTGTVLVAALHLLATRSGAGAQTAVLMDGPSGSRLSRLDLDDDPSFAAAVARARSGRSAEPVPASARPALAAAIRLALRDSSLIPPRFGPLAARPVRLPLTGIGHEWELILEPDGAGGLHGALAYAADAFEPVTAQRFAERYPRLLACALEQPELPGSQLLLLTAEERRLVLEQWNDTEMPSNGDERIHDLIARQTRTTPDALAVVCGEDSISYAELDRHSDRLAARLRELGAHPDSLVALCAGRSVKAIIGIVAVLKAGAAYVPLDPAYPRERLAFMLADCGAGIVLTDQDPVPLPADAPVALLQLAEFCGPDSPADAAVAARNGAAVRPDGDPAAHPAADSTADSLCYVIYTSGSTGQPKGAGNTHRGVLGTMRALAARLRLDSATRLLQVSSLNFDMSAFDIISTLISGGCLVIPEPGHATDAAELLALAHRADVTVWSSTPVLFTGAVDAAYSTGRGLPPRLRTVCLGGDRFPAQVPSMLADLAPGARAFNFAGMTEASFATTSHPVHAEDALRPSVPWGRPLPGQRMYVLDPHGEPTVPGAPGELFIGGAGVGRGYWNRSELTAQRFVPDPFVPADRPGVTPLMYRTGDRVRHLPDGTVEFLGRLDHQVKVRGFRVETGEIEAALTRHPQVRDSVVEARADDVGGERRLIAHVVYADPERPAAVEELRGFLAERLPEHMIPALFLAHPALPLAPGGKVDRSALASVAIPADRPLLDTPYLAPRDELEQAIVAEWELVLGVEGVGVHDDFAALGGYSLLATATMASLSEELDVPLAARDLFEASTPARLAARIRDRLSAD